MERCDAETDLADASENPNQSVDDGCSKFFGFDRPGTPADAKGLSVHFRMDMGGTL